MIETYLAHAAGGRVSELSQLTRCQELVLSLGTTLGLLVPLRSCGLRLTPTLALPPGTAALARGLAAGGMTGVIAQSLALLVALRLAARGAPGDVVLTLATAVFLLPWPVLAVPIATSASPTLAATAADPPAFSATLTAAVRSVVPTTAAAAAALTVAAAGAGAAAALTAGTALAPVLGGSPDVVAALLLAAAAAAAFLPVVRRLDPHGLRELRRA